MKSIKELEILSAELETADREFIASVCAGNYRPIRKEGLVEQLVRFVFNDLTGYQEEVDLSFWDEFDPMEYLNAFAGEEDGYRDLVDEVLEEAFEVQSVKPIKEKLWKNPLHKKVVSLKNKIEGSFLFCYYTLASRRSQERIEKKKQEAKEFLGISISDENRLLDIMGLVPHAFNMAILTMFNSEVPYARERKLLLEIPLGEFLANLHKGEVIEDHLVLFGIENDDQAREAYEQLKDFDDRLAKAVLNYKWYSFDDYGLAIYFSQSTRYSEVPNMPYSKATHDMALATIKSLKPKQPIEFLVLARAMENLGRNTGNPQYLKEAGKLYEKAGNFLKAMECQVVA